MGALSSQADFLFDTHECIIVLVVVVVVGERPISLLQPFRLYIALNVQHTRIEPISGPE